jgi:hypothetical protein
MSDYESDDSDLKRAIALSLQEVDSLDINGKPDLDFINLVSDDDDLDKPVVAKSKPAGHEHGNARPLRGIRDAEHNLHQAKGLSPTQDSHTNLTNNNGTFSKAPSNSSRLPLSDTGHSYEDSNGSSSKKKTDIDQTKIKQPGVLRELASKRELPESTPDQLENAPQHPSGLSSILGLDRKKMEEERLARIKKRKAESISPAPLNRRDGEIQQQAAFLVTDDKDGYCRAGKKAMVRHHPGHTSKFLIE